MDKKNTDIQKTKDSLENIYSYIFKHKEYINNLNVFPVPDGDTGLNMTLTIQGALVNTKRDGGYSSPGYYLKDFARQMLMHSRGCSGVILALYCNGVAEVLNDDNLSAQNVYRALENGYKSAYNGIKDPQEGTILTLMYEFKEKYAELMREENDPVLIIKETIPYLSDVLRKTPDMLPVLKKAGVVDSGGAGFVILIKGIVKEINNKSLFGGMLPVPILLSVRRNLKKLLRKRLTRIKKDSILNIIERIAKDEISNLKLQYIFKRLAPFLENKIQKYPRENVLSDLRELGNSWDPEIKYRYCTEFIINSKKISSQQQMTDFVTPYGDSLIILRDKDTYKVHVHTNKPNNLINNISEYGDIVFTKIDDMKKQHRNFISEDTVQYEKEQSIFCIVNGSGFGEILKNLGAGDIFNYGKNKPSVGQLVREINKLKAKNVIAAPDDKDILMSLKYAASLSKSNVHIIESESIVSLISMLMNRSYDPDLNKTSELMIKNLNDIRYCKVARAARQTKAENGEIVEKNDFFTVHNGTIITSDKNLNRLVTESIKILKNGSELVTLYRGIALKKKNSIADKIKEKFSDIEVEEYYGGQYGCYFYITLE